MNIAIVSIFFIVTSLCGTHAQTVPSGFYMLVKNNQRCDNSVHSISGDKAYCAARQAIIPIDQVQSVRSIGSGKQLAVDVRLTPAGHTTLRKIADALPESELMLVVDGSVVAVFDAKGNCISPITDGDLKWAQKHLGKLISN